MDRVPNRSLQGYSVALMWQKQGSIDSLITLLCEKTPHIAKIYRNYKH